VEKWQFERVQTHLKHVAFTRNLREDALAVTLHSSITTAQNHPPKSDLSSPETPPHTQDGFSAFVPGGVDLGYPVMEKGLYR
jgi:hypothetical protein